MELFDSAAIGRAFTEEVAVQGGRVTECVELDVGLFARSVNPKPLEVRRHDLVWGGVALRADDRQIRVRPYIFRLVCRNGTIGARALEARTFDAASWGDRASLEAGVREAVRACGSAEAFEGLAERMADTRDRVTDFELDLVAHLTTHHGSHRIRQLLGQLRERLQQRPLTADDVRRFAFMEAGGASASTLSQMLMRFADEPRRTRFDLLNAVTSVARDTHDPARKWDLEELGGAIAYLEPSPRPAPRSVRRREARALAV